MTLKPHIPDAFRSLRARVFFAVLVVGMIPVFVAVGWLVLYEAANKAAPAEDRSAEVYAEWARGPDAAIDPLDVSVEAGLLRLEQSGRLGRDDFDELSWHVVTLVRNGTSSSPYDYNREERIRPADEATYRENGQTIWGAGMYSRLGDDQIAELRKRGVYWGSGT